MGELMSIILEYSFFTCLLLFLNFFMLKKGIFLGVPVAHSHKNQIFFSKKVPKSLGLIILLFIFYKINITVIEKFFIFSVYFLGFQSDINKLNSPKIRILTQFLIVLIFLIFSKSYINSTRIPFIDNFLLNDIFKISLTLVCIIIVINGSNFIDGLNTLCIGYYLGIFLFLNFMIFNNYDYPHLKEEILYLSLFILILYFFNLFGFSFLGDSGSYLLGFFTSYSLVRFHNLLPDVSPWLIANLLWYPAFEILFSIVRRFKKTYNPLLPDNQHLHQIIYIYLKNLLPYKKYILNPLTANIINTYNYFIFFLSCYFYKNTKYLVCLFLFSCFVYIMSYLFFSSHLKKN
jgi:UDP-N-acetylmuramyl pentapeptide phosphotransferase/UDP-N-acetylglucosamine-1-phosphate transferase